MKSTAQVYSKEQIAGYVETMRRMQPQYKANVSTLEAAGRKRPLTKAEQDLLSGSHRQLLLNGQIIARFASA